MEFNTSQGVQNGRKMDISPFLCSFFGFQSPRFPKNCEKNKFLQTISDKNTWTNVHISIIRQSISEHSASIMTRSSPQRFISEIYRVDLRLRMLGFRFTMKLDESYCSRYARTQATRANSFPSLLGLLTKNKALYWAKLKSAFFRQNSIIVQAYYVTDCLNFFFCPFISIRGLCRIF